MAEAARPGATVSAPCDLAQLTTPTYARGRLAKLRREAGRKGSGRCEMARVCCAFHELDQRGCHRPAIQAPRWIEQFVLRCLLGILQRSSSTCLLVSMMS